MDARVCKLHRFPGEKQVVSAPVSQPSGTWKTPPKKTNWITEMDTKDTRSENTRPLTPSWILEQLMQETYYHHANVVMSQ